MEHIFAAADLQGWIDIAFVLVVVIVCLPGLLNDPANAERRSGRWKEELSLLERTLRELINEAGAAGSKLDQRLLVRQRELEQLVLKLEKHRALKDQADAYEIGETETTDNLAFEDDLPNPSWSRRSGAESTPSFKIEELAAEKSDKVSISASSADRVSKLKRISEDVLNDHARRRGESAAPLTRARADNTERDRTLAEQIDIEEEQGPSGMFAHLDPVTYKIARRMLLSGQEIHVVARKLELPVAELRILDKMLRQGADHGIGQAAQSGRSNGFGGYESNRSFTREVALL